jgi:hypothetical protein
MARASTQTLLSLDRWASVLGIDPFTFNQIGLGFPDNSVVGLGSSCNSVFYQTAWQGSARSQQLSREEIALAIARAEDMLAEQLTFYPAPKYITQEMNVYPHVQGKPYAANGVALWQTGFGFLSGAWARVPSVQLAWHKVWGGGILARTDYGDTANLTLIDSTTGIPAVAPAFNDAFTCTIVVPTGTLASEIGVYFRPADRVPINTDINETWRIRPVTITVSGTTATITGHITLLVKPNLESGVTVEPLDVSLPATYVTQVNVERVYRDDTQQGNAFWEAMFPCDEAPCDLTYQPICIADRNARMGQVAIHFTDNDCCTQWRAPDLVTVNYLAGEPLVNNEMSDVYAQMVTFLSAGLLASFTCGCERAKFLLEYWQHNVTQQGTIAGRTVEPRQLNQHEAASPVGFTNGGLYAWNRMTVKAQVTGVSV